MTIEISLERSFAYDKIMDNINKMLNKGVFKL